MLYISIITSACARADVTQITAEKHSVATRMLIIWLRANKKWLPVLPRGMLAEFFNYPMMSEELCRRL